MAEDEAVIERTGGWDEREVDGDALHGGGVGVNCVVGKTRK